MATVDDLLKTDEESSAESQSDNNSMSDSKDKSKEGLAEEVEFNSLSGSAQDRIKKIIREKKNYSSELESLKAEVEALRRSSFVRPADTKQDQPDVRAAVSKLRDVGIATQEDVDAKVNQATATIKYQYELDRLEKKYDGSSGTPKFDREEYEDFITRKPLYQNYLPEDVYQIMFREELSSRSQESHTTTSLKPTKTAVQQDEMTPEYIEKRLKEPDGHQWYEENVDKINGALKKHGIS